MRNSIECLGFTFKWYKTTTTTNRYHKANIQYKAHGNDSYEIGEINEFNFVAYIDDYVFTSQLDFRVTYSLSLTRSLSFLVYCRFATFSLHASRSPTLTDKRQRVKRKS